VLVLTEMYYEQHKTLQEAFNEKKYNEHLPQSTLFDKEVLDYRAKYNEVLVKYQEIESQLIEATEKIEEKASQEGNIKEGMERQLEESKREMLELRRKIRDLEDQNEVYEAENSRLSK